MRLKIAVILLSAVSLALAVALYRRPPAPPDQAGAPGGATGDRLYRRIDHLDLRSVPLADALAQLADHAGVTFDVRWGVLEARGTSRPGPVDVRLRNVSVASALRVVLNDARANLAYFADGDTVVVSTAEDLDSRTVARIYDVRDILRQMAEWDDAFSGPPGEDDTYSRTTDWYAGMINDFLKESVYRELWDGGEGPKGSAELFAGRLTVYTSPRLHDGVQAMLSQLRTTLSPAQGPTPRPPEVDRALAERLPRGDVLDTPVADFRVEEVAAEEAFEALRRAGDANIEVDWHSLARERVTRQTKVSLHLRRVPVSVALSALLESLGGDPVPLGWSFSEGVVSVASVRDSIRSDIRAYDVRDLLNAGLATRLNGTPAPVDRVALAQDELEALIHVIKEAAAPDSWSGNSGSNARVWFAAGRLVIQQTPAGHEAVASLLAKLRTEPDVPGEAPTRPAAPAGE